MPEDLHRYARVHVQRREQVPASVTRIVYADTAHTCFLAAGVEAAVDIARLDCAPGTSREYGVAAYSPAYSLPDPGCLRSCSSRCSLSAATQISGSGSTSVLSSTFNRRLWIRRRPTRCNCHSIETSASFMSMAGQTGPRVSPLRKPRTRIKTHSAYNGS